MNHILMGIDIQNCFMSEGGTLTLPGWIEDVKINIHRIMGHISDNTPVIMTMDGHETHDPELSDNPDMENTFPNHALLNRVYDLDGKFIAYSIPWDTQFIKEAHKLYSRDCQNILPDQGDYLINNSLTNTTILIKNKFDVFEGNAAADQVFDLVKNTAGLDKIAVFGVATDICVMFAVEGLLDRGFEVYLIKDACAELDSSDLTILIDDWRNRGVHIITTDQYIQLT